MPHYSRKKQRIVSGIYSVLIFFGLILMGLSAVLILGTNNLVQEWGYDVFVEKIHFTPELVTKEYFIVFLVACIGALVFFLRRSRVSSNGISKRKIRQNLLQRIEAFSTGETDDDGRYAIHFTFPDRLENFHSQYNKAVIDKNIVEYIEHTASFLPDISEMRLHVHVKETDTEDEKAFREGVSTAFLDKYLVARREYQSTARLSVVAGCIGLAVLIFMDLFQQVVDIELSAQLLEVISSVLLWDAVGMYFLDNRKTGKLRDFYLLLADMDIVFEK